MRTCALTQHQTLTRGNLNCVFTEDGKKYCCIGAQPGRAQKSVQSGLYRLKNGLPTKEWDLLHKVFKRAEYAFDGYMDTEVIRHITSARFRVHFKTMVPSPSSSSKKGFGINEYLRSHIDANFTMLLFKHTLTTTIMPMMIRSYVILHSQELGRLLHFGLVTFFCSIHMNHTLFHLAATEKMMYISSPLTLKQQLLV